MRCLFGTQGICRSCLHLLGMGNEWISQRLEMGHNRSVSGLNRRVNDNPEIKGLCSKLPMMLPFRTEPVH
jgi:hypothetical protein